MTEIFASYPIEGGGGGSGGITDLTGDVTATGPGSAAATVAAIQGTTVSGTTGTGNVVFSNSPTLVTPALGTPSALVGTNITGTGAGFTSGSTNALKSASTTVNVSAATAPTSGQILTATSSTAATWQAPATSGTVTSVDVSGGTTGLTYSGGPITSSGTITTAGTLVVANGGTGVTTSTGSGSVVLNTSPTLVTPALGTPSALVGTNITGTATGLTSGITNALASASTTVNVSSATAPTSGQILTATSGTAATWQAPAAVNAINQLTGDVTAGPASGSQSVASTVAKIQGTTVSGTTGTVNVVFSTSPTLVTPALGIPSSGTLTSCTGLPISTGVSGLGTGVATFLGTPSSANLAAAVTDETGSGALVFATTPTLVTPVLGVAIATTINKVTFTTPATGSTLTIADGKILTANNTLTFTGTDTSSVAFGGGGTVPYLGTSNTWTSQNTFQNASGNPVHGTNTNDDASAGYLGEFISATGSQTGLSATAGTYTNITGASVSLTAGDWEVAYRSIYDTNTNTGTGSDFRYMYLQLYNSTDSALIDAIIIGYANALLPGTNRNRVQGTGVVRVSLAATKTVILRGGTEEANSATTQGAPTALAPANDAPYIRAWRTR